MCLVCPWDIWDRLLSTASGAGHTHRQLAAPSAGRTTLSSRSYSVTNIGGESFLRTGDEATARRLKALACTAPLHQLDSRKTRLDWLDGANYQMAEIALQAIDQVTIAMELRPGRRPGAGGAPSGAVPRRAVPGPVNPEYPRSGTGSGQPD